MVSKNYARLVLWSYILSALFYNSWPLGYILNPQAAHNGLASDLEHVGQPYYWIFVASDIVSGLLLVAAAYLVWRIRSKLVHSRLWAAVACGSLAFGVGTAIAALVPSACSVTASNLQCGTGGGSKLGLDAVSSGLAALGLFVSLMCISLLVERYVVHTKHAVRWLSWFVVLTWSIGGLLFCFFALSAGKAATALLTQMVFLSLCGAALVLIGCVCTLYARHSAGPGN